MTRRSISSRSGERTSAEPETLMAGAEQAGLGASPTRPAARVAKLHSKRPVATQEQKAVEFQALHAGEPFVLPNPWDAGSARVLAGLRFTALASTSSGFAFTLGRLDGGASLDEVVAHTADL